MGLISNIFGKILPEKAKAFIEDILAKDQESIILEKDKPVRTEVTKNYRDIWPSPVPTATPKPTSKPQEPSPVLAAEAPYEHKIDIPAASGKGTTRVPANIAQAIMEAFDKTSEATPAATILHHPYGEQVKGRGRGENVGFQTGPTPTDINYDKATGKPKRVYNPFRGFKEDDKSWENSEDRGLFRINNGTFYTLLNDPKWRPTMKQLGIIDTDEVGKIDAEKAAEYYRGMYDPVKNAMMARIVKDWGGWGQWFGALLEMLGQK